MNLTGITRQIIGGDDIIIGILDMVILLITETHGTGRALVFTVDMATIAIGIITDFTEVVSIILFTIATAATLVIMRAGLWGDATFMRRMKVSEQ